MRNRPVVAGRFLLTKKLDNTILQGIQTYVEVSADEGHALVGYRHFADEQALNDLLQRQGKAF